MYTFLLLGWFVFAATEYLVGSAHMITDDNLSTSKAVVSNPMSQSLEISSPSVVIVELPKTTRKKKSRKHRKNKFGAKKRPPPPANCISLWASCKSTGNVCCDHCAFCQCRLFRTVCYCRMGNPRC